jgi:hypothetical protein
MFDRHNHQTQAAALKQAARQSYLPRAPALQLRLLLQLQVQLLVQQPQTHLLRLLLSPVPQLRQLPPGQGQWPRPSQPGQPGPSHHAH